MMETLVECILQVLLTLAGSILRICLYTWKGLWSLIFDRNLADRMVNELAHSATYKEWRDKASELELLTGSDSWRANHRSNVYDYNLILSRRHHLKVVRESNDISAMMYSLRSGLLRNLGGITDPRLFCHSYLGTKYLIESYMQEVVLQLEHVADANLTELSRQAKIDFFMETRQCFGSSALLLHGGASFGMCHLGVVKTLYEHGLLPRIISGASVGALIAALVCVKTDEEIPGIFEEGGIDLGAFQRVGNRGNITRKITRLMTEGYLIDIKVLQACIQSNVGNFTFDEAFKRTKRVLNITVPSSRMSEGPQLLNYITSPNVLIYSAACTSASMLGFSSAADLLAKDKNGNIIKWTPSAVNYTNPITPSFFSYNVVSPETPLMRLSELFNVNHFIVSQANPYIIPFMSRGLHEQGATSDRYGQSTSFIERLARVALIEVKHRMGQLNQFGVLPQFFVQLVEEKVSGNVTIVPEVQLQDLSTIISNPTHESVQAWILKGEQATWPFLAMLKHRLMIELALDRILLRIRAEASASAIQAGIEGAAAAALAQRYKQGGGLRHHRQKSGPRKLMSSGNGHQLSVGGGPNFDMSNTGAGSYPQSHLLQPQLRHSHTYVNSGNNNGPGMPSTLRRGSSANLTHLSSTSFGFTSLSGAEATEYYSLSQSHHNQQQSQQQQVPHRQYHNTIHKVNNIVSSPPSVASAMFYTSPKSETAEKMTTPATTATSSAASTTAVDDGPDSPDPTHQNRAQSTN